MRLLHLIIVLLLSACLPACGTRPQPPNSPPTVAIMASGQVTAVTASAELSGSVGGEISLSGLLSTDPEGDALNFQWTLTTKPSGSNLVLTLSAAVIGFTPDTFGTFTFTLRVTDAQGAFAERAVPITVSNTVPNQASVVIPTFSAIPTLQLPQGIAVGGAVVLDATASRDPDGNALIVTSTLTKRPEGSATVLSSNGRIARFIADTPGLYRVVLRPQNSAGAFAETTHVFDARIAKPNAIVVANAIPRAPGQNSIRASVGLNVVLDGLDSANPDSGTATRTWSFASIPTFSGAQLNNRSGPGTQFTPDIRGKYAVQLTVTNAADVSNSFLSTVLVDNTQPIANIATPNALPSWRPVSVPVNTPVALSGRASSDADGEILTYRWSVVAAPSGSAAAPTTPDLADTRFTPDVDGTYVVRLRVTDPAGVFSQRTLTINASNTAPIPVVNHDRVNVVAGATVIVSAALSFDEDLDPLTYSWVVNTAPPFSAATLVTAVTPDFRFVADVPGVYLASVTVSDGHNSMTSRLVVRALPAASDSVGLPFVPIDARYDKQQDEMFASLPQTARNDAALVLQRMSWSPLPITTLSEYSWCSF